MKTLIAFLSLLALTLAVSCTPAPSSNTGTTYGAAGGTATPIIPTSWTVATWFIDPVSGNDNNAGTTSGAPLKTWHRLNDQIWGCQGSPIACPRLRQTTTVTFLSTQPDNTDPIYATPAVENGASLILTAALPAPACTGTLSGVVAKNRATPQLLNATLCSSAAVGQLVVNTTHPSRAWTFTNVSGTTYSISQPLAPNAAPPASAAATEVDTWANGDAYSSYALTGIYLNRLVAQQSDFNLSANSGVYVYNLGILGLNYKLDSLTLGARTNLVESNIGKYVLFTPDVVAESGASNILNSFLPIGAGNATPLPAFVNLTIFQIYGGVLGAASPAFSIVNLTAIMGDYDLILGGGTTANAIGGGIFGAVYIHAGTQLNVLNGIAITLTNTGAPVLWGGGAYNQQSTGRTVYTTPAVNTLKVATLKINGGATACSVGTGATAAWNCGITVSAANLDAALGTSGFGNLAFNPGGGTIASGLSTNY